MRKGSLWWSIVGWLLCSQNLWAQVVLPPMRSDTDYFLQLAVPAPSQRLQICYERRYLWSNNVLPISEGNRKTIEPRPVTTGSPFYTTDKLTRWEVCYRRWGVEYVEGALSHIGGNADAAQLWLDGKAKVIDPQRFYRPFAFERKGYWQWFGVRYTCPFRLGQGKGNAVIGLRYLRCQRFREGWLLGTHYGNRLLGEVHFFSSRGIEFRAPSGTGFAVDVAATFELGQKWQGLIVVEGLWGKVRWKRLREVNAFVDTGAFAQDPEGFIHNLPFLVGREQYLSLQRSVDRQWIVGLSHQHRRWSWVVMFADQVGKPKWHIGIVRQLSKNQRLFFSLSTPVKSASFGYASKNLTLSLSLSHPDITDAFVLGIQSRFGLR